jgi:hypothetical protein
MRLSRVTSLAAISAALLSTSALAMHPMTPLPGQHGFVGHQHGKYTAPAGIHSGTWTPIANAFPGVGFPDTALLMNDGTVMMHDGCTTDWYKLTPDNTGSYVNGTWTKKGSMPSGYTPLYFASQVMPNGQIMVNGGEYLNCNAVWTNKGAIYDPTSDTWTAVTAPTGWTKIGDAQSVVRSDGQYMLADCCTAGEAIATVSGTSVSWTATGTGKADRNDEEGWTQLPDQTILTVDCSRDLGETFNDVEIYSENTGAWTAGPPTPDQVVDPGSSEVGPAPLLPNGLVFQLGATPHTAVYDPVAVAWTAGPDIPDLGDGEASDSADGPAVVLPDGNILAQVSPGVFNGPSHFLEIQVKDPSHVKMKEVDAPDSAADQSSYEGRLLMLPTGQALWSSDVGDVQVYTPQGKPAKNAVPKIHRVARTLSVGSTNNAISGFGFNGLSFGGYYGDDAQMSSNRPIIRITNNASGHVCYATSHDYATGISDGSLTNAQFDVPASCETGASKVSVTVNGIASKGKGVTLD